MIFDRKLARLLLEICRFTAAVGFDDKKNTKELQEALNWIHKAGGLLTDEPKLLQGSETSVACIATYADKNIVAYMGTKTQFNTFDHTAESIKDWSQNLKSLLVPFALSSEQLGSDPSRGVDGNNLGGKVHKVFLEELSAVQGLVVKELLRRGGRNRSIYITGHSQGGAEAILATRALLASGFPVISTYTFAAPRPGNAEFAQSLPNTQFIHRIEFGDDMVPHVPLALFGSKIKALSRELKSLRYLSKKANLLLELIRIADQQHSFVRVGKLCYGSHQTRVLRTDLSQEQEAALFCDRLWSLFRHPERWSEHHHLDGTKEEVRAGLKGNYTALVSEFPMKD